MVNEARNIQKEMGIRKKEHECNVKETGMRVTWAEKIAQEKLRN